MRYKKVLILIVFFACSAVLYAVLKYENSDDVYFIIEPEYNEYLVNQHMYIKATLVNNSDTLYPLVISLSWNDVEFEIIDPNGNLVTNGATQQKVYEVSPNPRLLEPGEKVERIIDMDWFMRNSELVLGEVTGVFTIKAEYQGIVSNTITLNVNRPQGIDSVLYSFTNYGYFGANNKESFDEKFKILNEYKESKYAPQIADVLWTYLKEYYQGNELELIDTRLTNIMSDSYCFLPVVMNKISPRSMDGQKTGNRQIAIENLNILRSKFINEKSQLLFDIINDSIINEF